MFMEKEVWALSIIYKNSSALLYSGIYELLLIQKKSMSLTDYRKKVEVFDAITDNKDPEEVEALVTSSFLCCN